MGQLSYKSLLGKYIKNISSPQYSISDCFDSARALSFLCDSRISMEVLNTENTTPDLEKSTDALKYMVRAHSGTAVILDITELLKLMTIRSFDDDTYSE